MSDQHPLTIRVRPAPDGDGWLGACPELGIEARGQTRSRLLALLANNATVVTGLASARGEDAFVRFDVTSAAQTCLALLREFTARLATAKDPLPASTVAALREAVDALDDEVENFEIALTIGPALEEAKAALAALHPTVDPFIEHTFAAFPETERIPVLRRVMDHWVPPAGCAVTSRIGSIVSASLSRTAYDACARDPNVLAIEASRDGSEDPQ